MAIRKKSKAKITARAEPATATTAAPDPSDVEIIEDGPGDAPDDGGAGGALTADDARLKAATQQLGDVFESIERRRLEALDRRRQAIQDTIAVSNDTDVKVIVGRGD